jgi:hypothetical protein
MPSNTSPSPGNDVTGSHTTRSPFFNCEAGMCSSWPLAMLAAGGHLGAGLAQGLGLGLAAPFGHCLREVGRTAP